METTFTINQDSARLLSFAVFKSKLRSHAPYIEGPGMQEYRRMRGLLVDGSEITAYPQVFLFLPKGMPAAVEPCITLIKKVYMMQGLALRFPLHITAYGDQAETLQAKSFQSFDYKRDIGRVIEELAGGDHTPPHILTTLRLMPASRNTKIARDGLVFVVTNRLEDLTLSEPVKKSLTKHGNAYVVCLSDGIQACRFKDLNFVAHADVSTDV